MMNGLQEDRSANPVGRADMTTSPESILIVDDASANRVLLGGLLGDRYRTLEASDGSAALDLLASGERPDLILLDVSMPDMDGFEVCRRVKQEPGTREIPVIFLTARSRVADEQTGLELGAADYVTKPISPMVLLKRVRNHLELKKAQDLLRDQKAVLEQRVIERTRQLDQLQDVIMVAMGALAETRDPETGNHINRTQHYVGALAKKLAEDPSFRDQLTPESITLITRSAPLHDIGKVGISDAILLKPGKLTTDEFDQMKLHTTLGRDAIAAASASLSGTDNFLHFAKEISYSHHEKWDGSGYPEGLSGDDIPLSARIMAVADVYDALISKRPYKPAFPHETAVQIILDGSGAHFDPRIVDAFATIADDFRDVSRRFAD